MRRTPLREFLRLCDAYLDAVERCGPDSEEARRIREGNSDDREFLDVADAMDRMERARAEVAFSAKKPPRKKASTA